MAKINTILKIKKLPNFDEINHDNSSLQYQTAGSAGIDLMAAIKDDVIIRSGEVKLIPTGIAIALEDGFEAQIRPRSGLALKNGITILNSPGTIDSDYRGEISVILINHSKNDFTVIKGMRIAQMVIAPLAYANIEMALELDNTTRGKGGFGSTGIVGK